MPLERRNRVARVVVKHALDGNAVTIFRQKRLETRDDITPVANGEVWARYDRYRLDPISDTRVVQDAPGKFLARIAFASRRDVGMRKYAFGRNEPPLDDAAAERGHGRDLPLWEVRIMMVVARIG